MGNVRVCHNETLGADDRLRLWFSAAMHRDPFADAIIRPDAKVTGAAAKANVLWFATEHGALMHNVGSPKCCELLDDCVPANIGIFSDFDVWLD